MELAQQVKEFAEEVFETSKVFWTAQNRSRNKAETEITETEFLALDLLSKSQPQTVGDIQRHIGVLPAQMSRVIRSLEDKGGQSLIACEINPEDKRKINVEITPAGQEALEAYRQMKLGNIQQMLLGLNEHDRQALIRILRSVREIMRKPLPQE